MPTTSPRAVLLATDRPVLMAPAMNPRMWSIPRPGAISRSLRGDGVAVVGPNAGEMAERGEAGVGRMAEPLEIVAAAEPYLLRRGARPSRSKAGACSSRPARPTSRSIRCATSPTARPASKDTPSLLLLLLRALR